jgi:hypothetical protein
MSQKFYGSLCLSDILEKAKAGHSAFSKADNGKIYFNTNVWLNDEKDKFGNVMSVQLQSKKDLQEKEGKVYIGNLKESENKPLSINEASDLPTPDDLPF